MVIPSVLLGNESETLLAEMPVERVDNADAPGGERNQCAGVFVAMQRGSMPIRPARSTLT
jgi:hypothetical protein